MTWLLLAGAAVVVVLTSKPSGATTVSAKRSSDGPTSEPAVTPEVETQLFAPTTRPDDYTAWSGYISVGAAIAQGAPPPPTHSGWARNAQYPKGYGRWIPASELAAQWAWFGASSGAVELDNGYVYQATDVSVTPGGVYSSVGVAQPAYYPHPSSDTLGWSSAVTGAMLGLRLPFTPWSPPSYDFGRQAAAQAAASAIPVALPSGPRKTWDGVIVPDNLFGFAEIKLLESGQSTGIYTRTERRYWPPLPAGYVIDTAGWVGPETRAHKLPDGTYLFASPTNGIKGAPAPGIAAAISSLGMAYATGGPAGAVQNVAGQVAQKVGGTAGAVVGGAAGTYAAYKDGGIAAAITAAGNYSAPVKQVTQTVNQYVQTAQNVKTQAASTVDALKKLFG